jgi:hypothetical protein
MATPVPAGSDTLELLGVGQNGCVYTGIKCKNDKYLTENLGEDYVTKVIDVINGEKEKEDYNNLNKLISSLNPDDIEEFHKYFISGLENCDVNEKDKPDLIKNLKKCDPINKGQTNTAVKLMFLSEPNGGSMNLYDYIKTTLDISNESHLKNMFIALLDLFKAVDLLNRNDIYLFDLKSPNVTVSLDDDGSIRAVKIVDLASIKQVKKNDTRKYQLNNDYKESDEKIVYIQGTPAYYAPEMFPLLSNYMPIFPLNPYFEFTFTFKFNTYVLKSKNNNNAINNTISKTDYDKWHQNPRKNDVWALGVIMLEIYNKLYKTNYELYESLLVQVIQPMLLLDVTKRVDSAEALYKYRVWLNMSFVYTEPYYTGPPLIYTPPPKTNNPDDDDDLGLLFGGVKNLKKKARNQTKKIYRKSKTTRNIHKKNKTRKRKSPKRTRRRRRLQRRSKSFVSGKYIP